MKRQVLQALGLAGLIGAVFCGATADAGVLWYHTQQGWNSDSHLYSRDVAGGVTTDRGGAPGLGLLTDITFDGAGSIYGVGFPNKYGRGKGKLYALSAGNATDPASYQALSVNGAFSGTPNGLAWRDDTLYVSTFDKRFYALNAAGDGSWSVTKQGRMRHRSSGDLAFSDDGQLYAVVQAGRNAKLATIDIDSSSRHFGKDHLVGGNTGYRNVFGLAFDEGTLYGAATQSNFTDSELITLDTLSGAATRIGEFNAPVWGMTSTGGSTVPEPATVALLSLGVMGLIVRRARLRSAG